MTTYKVVIAALGAMLFALGVSYCTVTSPSTRPARIILIEEITPGFDVKGDCLIFRYFVDGTESFAVLRNEDEVKGFRRYLNRVGLVLEKGDL